MRFLVVIITLNITNNLLGNLNIGLNYMSQEPKIDFPPFYDSTNINDYLNWEMKVEQIFYCHQIDQEMRVTLAILSFS